jgi:hypothetical protein
LRTISLLVVELGQTLVQPPLDVIEDLDVVLERRIVDVAESLEGGVRGGDAGRLELLCHAHLILHAATLSDPHLLVR